MNAIGFNISSFLGLFDLLLAVGIIAASIVLIFKIERSPQNSALVVFYILQASAIPASLLLAGVILVFQGWRLDPLLSLAVFLLHFIIIFSVIKDFFLLNRGRLR